MGFGHKEQRFTLWAALGHDHLEALAPLGLGVRLRCPFGKRLHNGAVAQREDHVTARKRSRWQGCACYALPCQVGEHRRTGETTATHTTATHTMHVRRILMKRMQRCGILLIEVLIGLVADELRGLLDLAKWIMCRRFFLAKTTRCASPFMKWKVFKEICNFPQ